ncbi:MAG: Gfo/Idh/MocA family protein [Verrucomicrobiia bacterium]|jgi:predicted dehydrogenase
MKDKSIANIISRRQFVKGVAAAAAAFQVVPGAVLGLNGATSPNEKLNIAGIGIGGQGRSDLNNMNTENIVALCDVDWSYAAGTFKQYPNAKKYKDYRKMLDEQKDIDAVVVATPDHHHFFASMCAIQHGKHVYCEKPLTHSVWEARELAKAARDKKVATQMGNQGQASEETRRLCEFVWDGAIGNVYEAHIWTDRPSNGLFKEYWPQGVDRPKDTPPVPETLDWDLWIGPAPMRPYHPIYVPFRWRGWWDFGTGALGDIGCHAFDPVFRALKLGHPLTVEASSSRVNEETFPLASMVTYHFPARGSLPPVKLVWYDGGLRPPRPEGLPDGVQMGTNGRLLIGDKGFILGNKIFPDKRRNEYKEPPKTIPRSPGHYQEWILACKGGKPAGSNFDWAGPLTEVVLLGNIALRVQLREELTYHKIEWDPEKLQIKNLPEANKFIKREYRQGWSI